MARLRESIIFKSIAGIVLILSIFCMIVSWIGFEGFTDSLLSLYSDGAFRTAQTAARYVDADRINEFLETKGSTEEYQTAWENMDRLCNDTGVTFIYVIQPDLTDFGHISFLFSTINHETDYSEYAFGYTKDTTNEDYREKYKRLYNGLSDRELVIRDKGYIETQAHITAMVPLKASDGQTRAILCVQRQMDAMTQARRAYIHKVILVLLLLAVVVIIGQGIYLYRMLLKPVKQITEETARFARENVKTGKKLTKMIKNRDEVGQLAGSIDEMEEQIHHYVENLTTITAEKERISTELSLATHIQADMLPHDFPPFPDRTEFELFASMDPAKEVGGDFYDFFLVDDDHLCMVMADVSGKGVPAALFMMAAKIILFNNALLGKSPAAILADTNAAICSNNREEMFVTVWLGILEISTGKLTAANAGHEYPVICKPDGSFELFKDKHGFVIGGMDGVRYKEYELQLEPGSKLFVYTDGVPEATNAENQLFGTQRMIDTLNQDRNAVPEQVLKNVREAVDGFVKDAEQFDDLTMLCMEYRGEEAKDEKEL